MSITKRDLAEDIVRARHGFERNADLSLKTLLDRCHEVFDLVRQYSKQELFEVRDQVFRSL